jgi:redox-sensitive bicupin YhaK (pirin superfamily)
VTGGGFYKSLSWQKRRDTMSNLSSQTELPCQFENASCDAIDLVINPHDKDLGGFCVRRLLPNALLKSVGPWIFFDHMGPATFEAGHEFKVRPHPHIGIATVTYLFAGDIVHRDSLGSHQTIEPGAVNLMVTGSGVVHSERQTPERQAQKRDLHGLQLWLALPEQKQDMAPEFHHYAANAIPATTVNGVRVRVLMGEAYNCVSPVKTFSDTLYVEAQLNAGQVLELPASEELAVYVVSGSLLAQHTKMDAQSMVVFNPKKGAVSVKAQEDAQIAILGGEPLGHRHVEWNFVSTDPAKIEQAKSNWQAGRFAKVPGDEHEFIPLPD